MVTSLNSEISRQASSPVLFGCQLASFTAQACWPWPVHYGFRHGQVKHHNETVLLRATSASMRRAEAAAQTAAKSGERLARARVKRRASVEHIREKAVKV